ncbi:putative trehalose-6-phosphate hydrolase [Vibrio nigripulchritudo MADA3029]|uniref:alpha-glucosidase n=1 Tax=Vibrio nigripulchritudo TaxID=28173 RepID=UPI0003B1E659|nr:alpha-glucosidase [Vibrio nigripulchritudo]CCN49271.1 putative trehalose-6-phosphate hydrolase [Vibrio nigripulchritudo MADA3020]CCN54255.1 putative trehalose-6-phosphate hydrolase [Vibrio nigripulchritudo MADA3021]CCN61326.1 putative trehalose-6-phosphate hydrolase [Vibrio nigripulchritudo MADA3029]
MAISNSEWWRGAVIYQIYPRSYMDSNGDGIGDLNGITSKLPYIAKLGVDAIWLSPIFASPMNDFGYDIANYVEIDPMFGTLDDFKTLLDEAHKLGLKVIVDQVYSHSSDQHAWFEESRQDRTNPKADWYVWADAKEDGTPPNNWLSIFGGSAWQWDSRRQQYYQHNFLASQPDLNFHNPEVQQATLDTAKFWMDLGVDGFRLDVVNMFFQDKELRDNPPVRKPEEQFVGTDKKNPFSYQYHCHQLTQPENLEFLQKLRAVLDEYPDRFTVGEIGAPEGLKVMAEYTSGGDKLHSAYTFELLGDEHGASHIQGTLERIEENLGSGWPCFALSNHDVVRSATRWSTDSNGIKLERESLAKASMVFLLTLKGSACIYQGEELGLPEANVRFEDLQDPFGIEFWPDFKGRDGCRTPMIWNQEGGFSTAKSTWLPVEEAHKPLNAEVQQQQASSMLNFVQQFVAWRKTKPLLKGGDFKWHSLHPELISFERYLEDQRMLIVLNLTGEEIALPELGEHGLVIESLEEIGLPYSKSDGVFTLPSAGGFIANLKSSEG